MFAACTTAGSSRRGTCVDMPKIRRSASTEVKAKAYPTRSWGLCGRTLVRARTATLPDLEATWPPDESWCAEPSRVQWLQTIRDIAPACRLPATGGLQLTIHLRQLFRVPAKTRPLFRVIDTEGGAAYGAVDRWRGPVLLAHRPLVLPFYTFTPPGVLAWSKSTARVSRWPHHTMSFFLSPADVARWRNEHAASPRAGNVQARPFAFQKRADLQRLVRPLPHHQTLPTISH